MDNATNSITNATACSNCSTSPSQMLIGWVPESSGRGTLSLITTCLVTIFLCTWVVIHPRVYGNETYARLHKLALFLKAILAPEFIAVEGFQEWAQCQRMVEDCAALTEQKLKLIHAFYISMLALRYHTPRGDRVIWPNQYTWLLQQGLIKWEGHTSWGFSTKRIQDKSRADSATKLISLIQVSWFVLQSILRSAHALPLSQLESMTLSYIPLFTVTYFFWWNKPKDILSPSVVELPTMSPEQKRLFESISISNKFDNEGTEDQVTYWNVWYLTPRVFEKEAEDEAIRDLEKAILTTTEKAVKCSEENLAPEVPQKAVVTKGESQNPERQPIRLPKEIVVSHWDPNLYKSRFWPAACLLGASFGALHLVSWNTVFPTIVELWLWRVSALISILSMIIFMHFRKVVFRWDGPLTIISLVSPAMYMISRVVMMGQVFAALRAEDPAIYDTYEVSTYFIHLL